MSSAIASFSNPVQAMSVQPKPRRSTAITPALREARNHVTPRVPVLRPAVDEQDRIALAGLRHVKFISRTGPTGGPRRSPAASREP